MRQPRDDYGAVLHPWAVKLNLKSHLSKIKLANILAGDTCEPISLSNLEGYLAYREHSLENLQFVVWYQDYRKRFLALPVSEQALSPPPSDAEYSTNSLTRTERERILGVSPRASMCAAPVIHIPQHALRPSTPPPTTSAPLSTTRSTESITTYTQPQHITATISVDAAVKTKPGPLAPGAFATQPFKKECMRIIATFLRPDSVKELPLTETVRNRTVKALAHTTHPDVFLPAFDEICNILETKSIPGFLAYSSTLVNYPQQLLWFSMGITEILIGIGISVSLILTVPVPPQSRRAWRIFGSLFVMAGVCHLYTAFRGFCSIMHVRGRVQLRVWELQDVDEDKGRKFWSNVLDPENNTANPDFLQEWDPVSEDYKAIPDVGSDPDPDPASPTVTTALKVDSRRPSSSSSSSPQQEYSAAFRERPLVVPLHAARNGFNRPPVFGPNTVVRDPRIRALHWQVLREVFFFGFVAALIFSAIVIPVPSLNR